MDVVDRLGRQRPVAGAAVVEQVTVEPVEMLGSQVVQPMLSDRRCDVVGDVPLVASRGRRAEFAAPSGQPVVDEKCFDGDGPDRSSLRDVAIISEAGGDRFRVLT